MKRLVLTALVAVSCSVLFPATADAAPAGFILGSGEATMSEDADTVSYSLINLTEQAERVTLTTTEGGERCTASADPAEVPAARMQEVQFSFDNCDFPEGKTVALTLAVGDSSFLVSAERPKAADPDWGLMVFFLWSLLGGLGVVVTGWASYKLIKLKLPGQPAGEWVSWLRPLPGLGAKWSFQESWASNVTLVTAVFTGLFGTADLLKSVTGEDTPGVLSVITIGSALAVALVGVAPLVLQAVRDDRSQVLVVGLLVSAMIAVGAAGGLVIVIALSVSSLVTGTTQVVLSTGMVVALLLLAGYAVTSVRQNLIKGLNPEPDQKKEDFVVGAVKEAVGERMTEAEIRAKVVPGLRAGSWSAPSDLPAALI